MRNCNKVSLNYFLNVFHVLFMFVKIGSVVFGLQRMLARREKGNRKCRCLLIVLCTINYNESIFHIVYKCRNNAAMKHCKNLQENKTIRLYTHMLIHTLTHSHSNFGMENCNSSIKYYLLYWFYVCLVQRLTV